MRFLFAAILLFTTPCFAQMPIKYPEKVYSMSGVEFYRWATDLNQETVNAWKKHKAELKEPQWLYGMRVSNSSDYRGSYRMVTPLRWANPYYNPGPLVIVNPYCQPEK